MSTSTVSHFTQTYQVNVNIHCQSLYSDIPAECQRPLSVTLLRHTSWMSTSTVSHFTQTYQLNVNIHCQSIYSDIPAECQHPLSVTLLRHTSWMSTSTVSHFTQTYQLNVNIHCQSLYSDIPAECQHPLSVTLLRHTSWMSTSTQSLYSQHTSWTRNSVLILREASCSPSDRWDKSESISSINNTAGWLHLATANSARTIFSPSPTWRNINHKLHELLLTDQARSVWGKTTDKQCCLLFKTLCLLIFKCIRILQQNLKYIQQIIFYRWISH